MNSKNKLDIKWDANQIISFLEIYEKYDCLWDASSPSYLKRDVKNKAFECILKQLIDDGYKITLDQLKSKIKSLKDTYRNELNKIKKSSKSGAATEDVYKPKLSWFSKADAFLRRVTIGRNSSSSMVSVNIFFYFNFLSAYNKLGQYIHTKVTYC